MKKLLVFLSIALFCAAAAANATIIDSYGGHDSGTSVGANAGGARAAFDAAANPDTEITFEDLAVGTLRADPFTAVEVSPGVYVNYFGDIDDVTLLQGVSADISAILGFNTTLEGKNHLRFAPEYTPDVTPGVTFTYDTSIYAWGAYLTGLEPDTAGVVHVLFDDGIMEDVLVPDGAIDGGVQFFGFLSDSSFSAVNLELRGVGGYRDVFGIDDVVSAPVPEPATLLLLGSGLIGLAGFRRKFRK